MQSNNIDDNKQSSVDFQSECRQRVIDSINKNNSITFEKGRVGKMVLASSLILISSAVICNVLTILSQ